jgi:polar amino acid transport system substrate-binding protein
MVRTDGLLLRRAAALCCLLAVLGVRLALAAQPPVLNTDGAPPHSRADGTGFEDRIVIEAFRRIGVAVKLVQLPSERALQNADKGIDDGNYVRIAGLAGLYPNLIMVPEPMSEFAFIAFTRDPELKAAAWADLRKHRAAIVIGWKIAEQHLEGAPSLTRVRDEESLFTLLDKGRVEVVVSSLHSGAAIIRAHGYTGVRALAPPLSVQPMYLYLNKKHAALVPKLAEALRNMRRDGTLQRLTRAGLEEPRP